MGGRRRFLPANIHKSIERKLLFRPLNEGQETNTKPVWLSAMRLTPPSETITRPLPIQHTNPNSKTRKPSRMFQPQRLIYEEDGLRTQFYKDHPWELARPRMIIEMDGKDYQRYDWSKGLRQPGMPLCGESVVQRQMWLKGQRPDMTKEEIYDEVRKDFYALRHEEEVERRIAQEEARAVGAYFGKSAIQVALELEDEQFEAWKKWASRQIDNKQAEEQSKYTSYGKHSEAESAEVEEPELETVAA